MMESAVLLNRGDQFIRRHTEIRIQDSAMKPAIKTVPEQRI